MTAEFGLLSYDSINLGDEIQSLAARRFLPRVDRFVPREDLAADPGGDGPTKIIFNGWFLRRPDRWPPNEKIVPLLLSLHLSPLRASRWSLKRPVKQLLARSENVEWLRRHGPVGARDLHTLALLQRHGVESFHSSCLTLTFPRRDEGSRGDRVVVCDLAPELVAAVARRTGVPPILVSHAANVDGPASRLARAEALLKIYAAAKAVVTTRLHCALPCLALGTPVLFIPSAPEPERQAPGLALAHHQSARDFLAGRGDFDLRDPPPNPDAYRGYVPDLVRRCEDFVAL